VAPDYEAHEGNVLAEGTAEHAAWVEEVRSLLPAARAMCWTSDADGFMARTVADWGTV
jgi:hypothetical protein